MSKNNSSLVQTNISSSVSNSAVESHNLYNPNGQNWDINSEGLKSPEDISKEIQAKSFDKTNLAEEPDLPIMSIEDQIIFANSNYNLGKESFIKGDLKKALEVFGIASFYDRYNLTYLAALEDTYYKIKEPTLSDYEKSGYQTNKLANYIEIILQNRENQNYAEEFRILELVNNHYLSMNYFDDETLKYNIGAMIANSYYNLGIALIKERRNLKGEERKAKAFEAINVFKKAINYFQSIKILSLKEEEIFASSYHGLGTELSEIGDKEGALQAFENAVAKNLNNLLYRQNLGEANYRVGNYIEGAKQNLHSSYPSIIASLVMLGFVASIAKIYNRIRGNARDEDMQLRILPPNEIVIAKDNVHSQHDLDQWKIVIEEFLSTFDYKIEEIIKTMHKLDVRDLRKIVEAIKNNQDIDKLNIKSLRNGEFLSEIDKNNINDLDKIIKEVYKLDTVQINSENKQTDNLDNLGRSYGTSRGKVLLPKSSLLSSGENLEQTESNGVKELGTHIVALISYLGEELKKLNAFEQQFLYEKFEDKEEKKDKNQENNLRVKSSIAKDKSAKNNADSSPLLKVEKAIAAPLSTLENKKTK